jgi:hypothetical protein
MVRVGQGEPTIDHGERGGKAVDATIEFLERAHAENLTEMLATAALVAGRIAYALAVELGNPDATDPAMVVAMMLRVARGQLKIGVAGGETAGPQAEQLLS